MQVAADWLDGWATAQAIRAGEQTAEQAVAAALSRVDALEDSINAFTVVLGDEALEAARSLDAERAAGERGVGDGPLAGVPVSVKDHIWLADVPATNGSLALADFRPEEDCACVARLLAAGAIVIGKTNNPEFCYRGFTANRVYGVTRNPWRLDRTPGGSSGGAGAAVAAGMGPIALGTDGGGSIRIPAAFCGVVGHKPTFGLVPKLPGFKGWPTLSVDGPLARTVRDAALALAVMAGPAAADPLTYPVPPGDYVGAALHPPDLRGLRVAYTADLGGEAVEPVVRQAFAAALERFADLGCDLVEDHPYTERPVEMWNTIALAEGYASEGPLLRTHARRMTPGTADIIRAGAKIRGGAYVDAQNARAAYTRSWAEFLERYDLLLMPAMPLPAFSVGVDGPTAIDGRPVDPFFDDWCVLALPANLTGMPSTSVPIGRDVDGLPIGLQIMGRRWADAATLGAAAAYERVAPWRDDWPPAVRALD